MPGSSSLKVPTSSVWHCGKYNQSLGLELAATQMSLGRGTCACRLKPQGVQGKGVRVGCKASEEQAGFSDGVFGPAVRFGKYTGMRLADRQVKIAVNGALRPPILLSHCMRHAELPTSYAVHSGKCHLLPSSLLTAWPSYV